MPEIEAEYEYASYWLCNMSTEYDEVLGWCKKHLPKDSWHAMHLIGAIRFYSEKAYCWFTLRWGE